MFKVVTLVAVLVTGVSILSHPLEAENPQNSLTLSKFTVNNTVEKIEIAKTEPLAKSVNTFKIQNVSSTLTLEAKNTVILRGPVTATSVSKLQSEVNEMSLNLKSNDKIYLVLDTPGGSVEAGMNLIDHLKALPQKIETITLFSASMGFQIAQNMDTRYITPSGTLMSHRARGGVRGQFYGELESRYNMIKRKIDYLDAIAAKRLKIKVKDYKSLIKDEYWVGGFDAKTDNAADSVINLRCGKTLQGETTEMVTTIFGRVEVTLSKCPIIRGILGFEFKGVSQENRSAVRSAVFKGFNEKKTYVEEFILTNEHYKVFY